MIKITNKIDGTFEYISAPKGLSPEGFAKLAEDYLVFREKNPSDYIITY